MSSRVGARATVLALALVLLGYCLIPSRAAAQIGGHKLELGINGAYVEFADGIRFQDDVAISAYGLARFTSWLSMGLEMSWIGAQDEIQQIWQDIVIATARARVEPFGASRFSPGLLLGVSFMAFQDAPALDAISEGLDLGPSLRVELGGGWLARGDLIFRMQTFNRVKVDPSGIPTGEPEETGYLWSRLFTLGLGHGF